MVDSREDSRIHYDRACNRNRDEEAHHIKEASETCNNSDGQSDKRVNDEECQVASELDEELTTVKSRRHSFIEALEKSHREHRV